MVVRRRLVLGGLLAALALTAALALSAGPAQAERPFLDIGVFARVPNPGQPEPIAIGPGHRIYVGTNQQGKGDAAAPSKVFVYSRRGRLRDELELEGQELGEDHGIQGLAFDAAGRLYVLDRSSSPRVVRVNLQTGRQRDYALFRDVPSCEGAPNGDCSATTADMDAAPDYAAFAPSGALFVTDIEQALIWRVPPGGGRPIVWLTDPRLESVYGPNGIQVLGDGRTLLFASTSSSPVTGQPASGALYTVPLGRRARHQRELAQLWLSEPVDGPDGFAVGRSGTIYVALAGASQIVVISAQGEELARVPANPLDNAALEVPLDGPASAAFLGRRLLVTNQSFARGDPSSWAVLDVYAGERGLPLFYP